uniref:DUF4218 domain-containing protein n=1 Tax=Cajanus cajan TaxID=3821 RepID=A0A151QNB6_CAJCA|nr:hypothetical protein KK1_047707 [Cajanus cajan]
MRIGETIDMHHAHEVPIASNLDVHLDDVMPHTTQEEHESREYYELARDGQEPLYEGCIKYSRLSFLVKLYHIKCLCGISDKAMTMILELLNDAFENVKIPCSFYEAKKIITKLGLNYEKIHACPNNCMLYWGNREDEEREACKTCHTSRWKSREKVGMVEVTSEDNNLKKIPAKVLRDSEAWKHFNLTHKEFASDPRNVRLALATDGFNPFGLMSPNYSIRPVILIPYNMPPWLCMKPTSFIMSMIIPGKKMPGNDIDVYLQPLIKELNELWTTSVDAYDSFKKEMFKLRAALMWTISDFPGLGTLSGWNTYTGLACPSCNFDFAPLHLKDSGKFCFWGFRRYLDQRHRFRLCIIRFNGEQDMCNPPKRLSGVEILQQVENVKVVFGREKKKDSRKRKRSERFAQRVTEQWHKKSIFFDLIYWKQNCLRHCLDVMHIEKNVCDNIINTLLNVPKKSKDHVDARKDLKVLGIRPDLWPNENGRYPQAIFTLSSKGKRTFLTTLKNISVPDGYSSNISRCIDLETLRFNGMLKSHDCHILMEQLLPLAMRSSLPDEVSTILIELCSFFRQLCGKVLKVEDLDKMQNQIVLTLCHMEMIFPHSFFTVMVHLKVQKYLGHD